MRLFCAVALVVSMSGTEIERAQAVARARDSERQQFHARYIVDLSDATVTHIEVITEFRRLVMIAEGHALRGDWMFTRSVRAAEEALATVRGLTTVKATVRFSPLNTFVEPPAYALSIDGAEVDTQMTPDYSVPFKARDGRTLTSLVGAELEASVPASRLGQRSVVVAVTFNGNDVVKTTIDFKQLD